MAVFFFLVGLEIKREVLIEGAVVPCEERHFPSWRPWAARSSRTVLFISELWRRGQKSWGHSMATDIAFALGVLAVLGNRVPFR
jgi:NhaA family Na+:H+ antiporter